MSDSGDDKLLNIKMEEDTNRIEILDKTFEKICDSETDLGKHRTEAIEKMKKINELDNNTVKKMFTTVAFSMENIEKHRNQFISDIKGNIIPALKYYPEKIKEIKKNLEEIQEQSADIVKKTNALTNAKSAGDMSKVNTITHELTNAKNDEMKKSEIFETKTTEYEVHRIEDNKAFLLHFIHSKLAFHVKSLESLSKLYSEINNYEPKGELCDFVKKYGIMKDLNEQQLSQRFDFQPGVTERKKGLGKAKTEKKENIKKKIEDEDG